MDTPEQFDVDLNPELYELDEKGEITNERNVEVVNVQAMDDAIEIDKAEADLEKEVKLERIDHVVDLGSRLSAAPRESPAKVNDYMNGVHGVQAANEEETFYPISQVTLPFDNTYTLHQSKFTTNPQDGITSRQQSKLINFIDEKLLQIQRNYIKSQAAEAETYSFPTLSDDLNQVIDLLWIPIKKGIPLFGQVDYLIRILSDLEDYLMHYPPVFIIQDFSPILSSHDRARFIDYFNFFQSFDVKLSIVYDGFNTIDGKVNKMGTTQLVRLTPIITRLRIIITDSIEPRRNTLNVLYNGENEKVKQEAKEVIDTLDVECGRLFEGLFERMN